MWGPRLRSLQGAFVGAFARANPDMQARFGYEPDTPNEGNLAICSNQSIIHAAHRTHEWQAPRQKSLAILRFEPRRGQSPPASTAWA